ncbi:MAG TPA: gluconate 2-dehydrogenase subunit 3 family protein [Candidatus Acidoferrum sp.]|nr:gluconate 2-dehydrogenase subunit 3 family protein [Candidatus Acidoferrum sp.]
MQRRDALKLLMVGAALPALSPDVFAFFRAAHPAEGYTLRTLSPHLNETVVAMIDLIVPATDTPGAKGARVNEFIDLILTEWCVEDERKNFLDGLAGVDKRSNELYGKDFVGITAAQQAALLREMDDEDLGHGHPPARNPALPKNFDKQMTGTFWRVFKGITLHGYYTSEIGFSQELKLQVIPGSLHGCMPMAESSGDAKV